MQKLKCVFGFHNYSKFKCVEEGDVKIQGVRVGTYYIMERVCADCGYIQRKRKTVY